MIPGSYPTGAGPLANRSHPAARSAASCSKTAEQSAVHVSWFEAQYVIDNSGIASRSAAFGELGDVAIHPVNDPQSHSQIGCNTLVRGLAGVVDGGRHAPHDAMGHLDELAVRRCRAAASRDGSSENRSVSERDGGPALTDGDIHEDHRVQCIEHVIVGVGEDSADERAGRRSAVSRWQVGRRRDERWRQDVGHDDVEARPRWC